MAAAIAAGGTPVFAYKGESLEEYWEFTHRIFDFGEGKGPNMILDDGGDATLLMHLGGNAEKDAAAAWRRLVKPADVVGVKSNVWGPLATPRELEQTIRDGIVGAGVRPENVDVDDRGVRWNPVFQRTTALVNVRPMRTHAWSGLGTCSRTEKQITAS